MTKRLFKTPLLRLQVVKPVYKYHKKLPFHPCQKIISNHNPIQDYESFAIPSDSTKTISKIVIVVKKSKSDFSPE